MTERKPRYPKEEFTRRGQEIFDRKIEAVVKDEDPFKFVAIDIETGDFEVDVNRDAAADRLTEKNPDAQIWMRRVGFPVADWIRTRPPGNKPRLRKVSP